MSFYLHFAEQPEFAYKFEWNSESQKSVDQILKKFIEVYNEKYGKQRTLALDNVVLVNASLATLPNNAQVSKIANPTEDLFVKEKVPAVIKVLQKKCTHKGCEKDYVENENTDTSCTFHAGVPVFHEGLKGWSCCSKRVLSFEEFLQLPGCTTGSHSDEVKAPPPVEKKIENIDKVETKEGLEIYKSSNIMPNIPLPQTSSKKEEPVRELNDPPDAVIAKGTTCKRSACNSVFVDDSSRTEKCTHHPGVPIFHEGSKGWTCCKRKVLEFDEFLKLEGCTDGKHRFLDIKKDEENEEVKCRYDWFQSSNLVTVSVYGKNVSKEESQVIFEDTKVFVKLKFKDGKRFTKELKLWQPILPQNCKYEVLSTKTEIFLSKVNTISWRELEA